MRIRLKHLMQADLDLAANVSTICTEVESTLFILIEIECQLESGDLLPEHHSSGAANRLSAAKISSEMEA